MGEFYVTYIPSKTLSDYGKIALSRLADVYVAPRPASSPNDVRMMDDRRHVALELILKWSGPEGGVAPNDYPFVLRQQAEAYRNYANRMRILAERVEGRTTPNFAAPALDSRSQETRLRRACEILLALEDAQTKPVPATQEAALVKELETLQQDFSASTLVEYLDKPVEGVDKNQVKSALVSLGELAIPELIRFLRADGRSQESLKEALPVLIALCKTSEETKERLLKTAQTYEEGAKLFDEKAEFFLHPN